MANWQLGRWWVGDDQKAERQLFQGTQTTLLLDVNTSSERKCHCWNMYSVCQINYFVTPNHNFCSLCDFSLKCWLNSFSKVLSTYYVTGFGTPETEAGL